MIKCRVTYVAQIIRNDNPPRPLTDREHEIHQAWMRTTGSERMRLWEQLEGEAMN